MKFLKIFKLLEITIQYMEINLSNRLSVRLDMIESLSNHFYCPLFLGTLSIIVKDQSTKEERIFLTESGNQGNKWKTTDVTVQNSNPYKVSYW